jgi:hypothetical protein
MRALRSAGQGFQAGRDEVRVSDGKVFEDEASSIPGTVAN